MAKNIIVQFPQISTPFPKSRLMATPLVFRAKEISIKLISIAFAVLFLATILVSFDSKKNIGYETSPNAVVIPLPGGAVGPESFAFDGSGGGPYTGVSDGRIIRWRDNESRWVDFAVTSLERWAFLNYYFILFPKYVVMHDEFFIGIIWICVLMC